MYAWLPIGLENRENLQNRESIFQTGKVGGKIGNFIQNSGKIMTFWYWKIGENSRKTNICRSDFKQNIEKVLEIGNHAYIVLNY